MKTVYTTLPIYKALKDQCYERGLANGSSTVSDYIFCPKHRLPSFQWIDDGDGASTVSSIYLVDDEDKTETDITGYFVTLPTLYTSVDGDDYFIYNGEILNYALPEGKHYLKIIMDTNHIYYSEKFLVQCVYCPFATSFVNHNFTTFNMNGMEVLSAIHGAAAAATSLPQLPVYLGQQITVIFYLTNNGGATLPSFLLWEYTTGAISNEITASEGLNELTLTATKATDICNINMRTSGACNFTTSEILVHTQYACGYVTLSFSNCCNLGDLLYEDDFVQTLWIKSDNIEQAYPYVEKGQENGYGKFIPTFRRQEKTYLIRTGIVSQYLVDVLQRLKLHDVITYIDQVGDAFAVESIDADQEWLFDDKYYANASITLNLGEEIVVGGCCE
jgi:hypothetical protein